MKKIINYLFVAILAITTVLPFVKAEKITSGTFTGTKGKITITAQAGHTLTNGEEYNAYRILDLESYDATKEAYAYKANSKWSAFINSAAIKGVYVNVDTQGYVTWVKNADVATFAKLAYQYALDNGISADATKTVADNKVEFTELPLGYYLVNSSIGVVCSLDTTNNEVTIQEKNLIPTIDKVITTTNSKVNTASIGDNVPYSITLTNIAGLKNVNDIEVKNGETTLTKGTDYTVTPNGQSITIEIKDNYTKNLTANSIITITYTAKINEKAVTNIANTNDAELVYGNGTKVETDPTKTYTYGFKFHKTNGTTALTGAEFKLYDSETNGKEIKVIFIKEENGINYYRVATTAEESRATVMEAGIVVVEGLKTGTYYLEETKQPEGYNKLAARVEVTVVAGTDSATYNFTDTEVINTTGALLPSTGGIGTTLFVVIGMLLIAGFGVTLITKFRMAKEY